MPQVECAQRLTASEVVSHVEIADPVWCDLGAQRLTASEVVSPLSFALFV